MKATPTVLVLFFFSFFLSIESNQRKLEERQKSCFRFSIEKNVDNRLLSEDSKKGEKEQEEVEVIVLQKAVAQYGEYVWPSCFVLAEFIVKNYKDFKGKRILEVSLLLLLLLVLMIHDPLLFQLGAGTSLPGILAAKLGSFVTLTDLPTPDEFERISQTCLINDLTPFKTTTTMTNLNIETRTRQQPHESHLEVRIAGLCWGNFDSKFFSEFGVESGDRVGDEEGYDWIIAADCFYDTKDFEDVLATVRFFFDQQHPSSTSSSCSFPTSLTFSLQASSSPSSLPGGRRLKFITTYQERNSNRSLLSLLLKWKMSAVEVRLSSFYPTEVEKQQLLGSSTIRLFVITSTT
jgi:predicted nicotinamide N-methyase